MPPTVLPPPLGSGSHSNRRPHACRFRSSRYIFVTFICGIAFAVSPQHGRAQTLGTGTDAASGSGSGVSSGSQVQLEGELEIRYEDDKGGGGRVKYALKTADGKRTPLNFQKNPPTDRLTGDQVIAGGAMVNGTLLLYSGSNLTSKNTKTSSSGTPISSGDASSSGGSSSSIPVPNTFGAQYTLIILVNFQDDAIQPWTVSEVQDWYSGPVNDFFEENSYGQTSIVPSVVGWYTLPDSVTTCNTSQIATDAQNAAVAAGVKLSNYTRYIYVFPSDGACAFAGSSTVGGNPSESWINGDGADFHTFEHELGHAFGLWHSHALDCGTSATICSNGTSDEYGDLMDTMGATADWSPDYNAFQKERLGWLDYGASPSIQTVTSSGAYTINPYELDSAGPNALKILQSTDPTTGAKTWYYLEARQPTGSDAFLTTSAFPFNQSVTTGVLFRLGTDGNSNSSELLDMTPATPTFQQWWDMALQAGQGFTDSTAGVTFAVTSVNNTGATVQVTINGSSASSGPLTTSVTTNQSSYLPGQTVGVIITVLSGTSPAGGVSVSATITNPNGKAATLKGTTGSAGTAQLNYALSKNTPAGTYRVGASSTSVSTTVSAAASTSFNVQ